MQYQVTYRLIHSEYLPSTFIELVHAHTHYELTGALATVKRKWEARGYHFRLLRIREVREWPSRTNWKAKTDQQPIS